MVGRSIPKQCFTNSAKFEVYNMQKWRQVERILEAGTVLFFFHPEGSGQLVPGVVHKIFSIPRKQNGIESRALFLAVHRYKPLPDHVDNPFKQYEEFGASLWSDERGSLVIVIPSQKICHATFRQWQEGVFVMCPIDRVSFWFLQYIRTMD